MKKMHPNEFAVDTELVHTLLTHQCPQWAQLALSAVPSSGTDHALFRLGEEFIVRLPRIDWAAAPIAKEYAWLPKIAPYLTMPISTPIFQGQPETIYPWPWLVSKWQEGENPVFEQNNKYVVLAQDLANFLNELHAIPILSGPASRRGVPLQALNEKTLGALSQLQEDVDVHAVTTLWQQCIATPSWNQQPVWVHGDFLPGNILVQQNRLCGVIDFSDVGMGDPACDLVIAWSLFNSKSRTIFKNHLAQIDDNTWMRGKGWALSIASIMLTYYKNTNPVLAQLARRMINQVLADE